MAVRPRILFIAPTMPARGGNGLAMRVGLFLEGLAQAAEVDLVVVPVAGTTTTTSALCDELGVVATVLRADPGDNTHFSLVMDIADPEARRHAFSAYGRPSLSACLAVPLMAELQRHIEGRHYDGVHIARSYLLPLLELWPAHNGPPISADLDEDDVTTLYRISELHRLRGDEERALWDQLESAAFNRLLQQWLPRVSVAFVSSAADERRIKARHPDASIELVPNGVTIPPASPTVRSAQNLLFVGGFGYAPNLDAALWICEVIWPRLRASYPARLSLMLVGGNAPRSLRDASNGNDIELKTSAADLGPLYDRASLALIPIRAGGGTRIKLLEAAAHLVPVVSTGIGAEGLELSDGRDFWLGDGDTGFTDACLNALSRPEESARRAQSAAEIVRSLYSRERITAKLGSVMAEHWDRAREHEQ